MNFTTTFKPAAYPDHQVADANGEPIGMILWSMNEDHLSWGFRPYQRDVYSAEELTEIAAFMQTLPPIN